VLASLEEKEVALSDQEAHRDAQKKLAHLRAELDDPGFNIARVMETSSQQLMHLWRHEAGLNRTWLRAMHELERLQARRAGEYVPVPTVCDVNLGAPQDCSSIPESPLSSERMKEIND
jgi:hypothetical protein